MLDVAAPVIKLILHRRFVDRDMLMRYHKGLGVGHVYRSLKVDDELLMREGRLSGNQVLPFFAEPVVDVELFGISAPYDGQESPGDTENPEGQASARGKKGKENGRGEGEKDGDEKDEDENDEGEKDGDENDEKDEKNEWEGDLDSDVDSEPSIDLEFDDMYGDPFDLDYIDYED